MGLGLLIQGFYAELKDDGDFASSVVLFWSFYIRLKKDILEKDWRIYFFRRIPSNGNVMYVTSPPVTSHIISKRFEKSRENKVHGLALEQFIITRL